MRTPFATWMSWVLMAMCFALSNPAYSVTSGSVAVLEVQGAITPATSDFIIGGIEEAEAAGAHLLIIELDTPGGLDASMRAIIRRMLSSNVPIAVYVAPGGARAASAGTFILYASHIAAMTPASNLGAASPVAIGAGSSGNDDADRKDRDVDKVRDAKPDGQEKHSRGVRSNQETMAAKAANDAVAYLRSLAQLRGRDIKFAEAAVREADSLSANDALSRGVVEYLAPTLSSLLEQIDGKEIRLDDGTVVTFATRNAQVERLSPDWRNRILGLLANPQLAVILMMLGIYGLFFEMMSPGATLPGVAGLICLLLSLYGLHLLPVNWAGVALLGVGALMMIGEVFLPSFGALGIGGLIAFVLGGLFMTGPDLPAYYELSIPFLVSIGLASAAIIIGAGTVAIRSRRNARVIGHETMVGEVGRVVEIQGNTVYAEVRGENWRVDSVDPLQLGDQIRVTATHGLQLKVERL